MEGPVVGVSLPSKGLTAAALCHLQRPCLRCCRHRRSMHQRAGPRLPLPLLPRQLR